MKKIFVFLIALFLIPEVSLHAEVRSHRIVGGYESDSHAWQWMAALVDPEASNAYIGFFCGGTLIHSRWILTAAHCVKENDYSNNDLEPRQIEVLLNIHDLKQETGDRVRVKRIISDSRYDNLSDSDDYDIALLELEREVYYQTIPLLTDDGGIEGKTATVIGWGYTNHRDPTWLMEVRMPIVSNSLCNQAYNADGSYGHNPVTDRMLCAGSNGKDACAGDSGGPLMVEDSAGTWKQAGIVTWGADPCASQSLYGVYTRVSRFRDFVSRYVPPDAPKLRVTVSGIKISLSWAPVSGAQGYTLFYAPYPDASYIASSDMGTKTTFACDLWKGAAFYAAIRSYNSVGSSSYSNIESVVIPVGK